MFVFVYITTWTYKIHRVLRRVLRTYTEIYWFSMNAKLFPKFENETKRKINKNKGIEKKIKEKINNHLTSFKTSSLYNQTVFVRGNTIKNYD